MPSSRVLAVLCSACVASAPLAACGGASDPPAPSPTSDPPVSGAATRDAGKAASKLVTVRATVRYAGSARAPLSVGLFTENPPKTRPPVAFDTSTRPTFPFSAELRDVEPGTYWVIAVLDLPPTSAGAVVLGAEDIQASSEPVVLGSTDGQVDVVLKD